jgi:hypothetical protein
MATPFFLGGRLIGREDASRRSTAEEDGVQFEIFYCDR